MKYYRLEGEIWEAEMVEDKDGEYVKREDVDSLEKIAKDLVGCLLRSNIDCGELSHRKNQYHNWAEECPVVKKINSTLEKYEKLCKTH